MKCPICNKEIQDGNYIRIDIEDFELPVICKECITEELQELIDNAEYLHTAFQQAAAVSYQANEAVLNKMTELKNEKN